MTKFKDYALRRKRALQALRFERRQPEWLREVPWKRDPPKTTTLIGLSISVVAILGCALLYIFTRG